MTGFVELIQSGNINLYLTQGLAGNIPVWHYVKVYKQQLPLFLSAIKSGTLDITNFGKVVISGWGEEPPEHVKVRILKEYAKK